MKITSKTYTCEMPDCGKEYQSTVRKRQSRLCPECRPLMAKWRGRLKRMRNKNAGRTFTHCEKCKKPLPIGNNPRDSFCFKCLLELRNEYISELRAELKTGKPPVSCARPGCDVTFVPQGSGSHFYCSERCRNLASYERKKERKAGKKKPEKVEAKPIATLKRVCHDCGKPTANYRCPECLDKWRRKHGVVAEAVGWA